VPYVWYLLAGKPPLAEDPRVLIAAGLVLGGAADVALGRHAFGRDLGPMSASVAVLSGAIGVTALVLAGAGAIGEVLMGVFIVSIVVAWVLAEALRPDRRRHGGKPSVGP
jgi:hypothetical protein